MANRSFEMYEYREVLLRIRQGATGREIAWSRLMSRKKARQVREIADGRGWLDPAVDLPADAALAEVFARQPSTSSVSPLADVLYRMHGEEVTIRMTRRDGEVVFEEVR